MRNGRRDDIGVFVKLSDAGTVNLLSQSYGVYNINELGLQKWPVDDTDHGEKTYRCASHEMRVFGAIGAGASSVVQRAIHIPTHRIIALKKINIFEKVCEFHFNVCLILSFIFFFLYKPCNFNVFLPLMFCFLYPIPNMSTR